MPLLVSEQRCVHLACVHLSELRGGEWKICEGPTLDEQYPSEPSPEVLITDGTMTAAVEVKSLTGDSVWNEFTASMLSLERSLIPSIGGYYVLLPCADFRLPIQKQLMRHLRREIERVAKSMNVGDQAVVRIPRQANIHLVKEGKVGLIHCCHDFTGDIMQRASDRVSGAFLLDDLGQWEHSFVTDEARENFSKALVAACQECEEGGSKQVKWYEEWGLSRQESDTDGVAVTAATEFRDLFEATKEAVQRMLDKGKAKFVHRQWADLNVLVLEKDGVMVSVDRVIKAISTLASEKFEPLDLVLLVDGEQVVQVWTRSTTRM